MTRPTPLCHLTLGHPVPLDAVAERAGVPPTPGGEAARPCIGSACSAWVGARQEPGAGWCALVWGATPEGVRPAPWIDPAYVGPAEPAVLDRLARDVLSLSTRADHVLDEGPPFVLWGEDCGDLRLSLACDSRRRP